MKRTLLMFFCIILLQQISYSQWSSDVRLTNNSANSLMTFNNQTALGVSGDTIHLVWMDDRDGNLEIYYKRSTNNGSSWLADTRLTTDTNFSFYPAVAASGSTVHVVWQDDRDGNPEIYYKRSTNGGTTWSVDTRLTNQVDFSIGPSVAVSGNIVHVVWQDFRDGNPEIYYKRSTNGGTSWSADMRLTNDPNFRQPASVSASGNFVHIAWMDLRDGNPEIYYKRSTNDGVSWLSDTRLTNNTNISTVPTVSVSGSNVSLCWVDDRDGNTEIYYKRSTNGGVSWSSDTRLTNDPNISTSPSIISSGTAIHVVWQDDRDGNNEIYYKRSTDNGINWIADFRLTNNAGASLAPSVSVSGLVVHVAWQDDRDGNSEIYYKRNPTGNPTSISIIGTELPVKYSLYQNYPNPFNPETSIEFDVPEPSFIKLSVIDLTGREVEILVNENLLPGKYQVNWNATGYSSGVYFYKLITNGFVQTRKMILNK